MAYTFITIFFLVLYKIFYRFKVYGRENVPGKGKGAFIIASNHCSHLDPPIIAAGCIGIPLNYLAKEELFRNPIFGWYIRSIRAFPVKRGVSDIGSLKTCIKRIRQGEAWVMFPEGSRSEDGTIQSGRLGTAMLAFKTRIPVIPAYIKGSLRAFGPGSRMLKPSKISVRFGKPIFLHEEEGRTYEKMTEQIMSAIRQLSQVSD